MKNKSQRDPQEIQNTQKNFSAARRRPRVQVHFDDSPSLTQQQYKNDTSITYLIERFVQIGQLPGAQNGQYLDLGSFPSYSEGLNTICKANEAFAELPAKLRFRFDNDPGEFVKFASDPKNLPEMVKLGLATVREQPVSSPAANSQPKTGSSPGAPVPAVGEGPKT